MQLVGDDDDVLPTPPGSALSRPAISRTQAGLEDFLPVVVGTYSSKQNADEPVVSEACMAAVRHLVPPTRLGASGYNKSDEESRGKRSGGEPMEDGSEEESDGGREMDETDEVGAEKLRRKSPRLLLLNK